MLDGRSLTVFGVEGWPACGTPPEALRHHRLDGASLAERISAAAAAGGGGVPPSGGSGWLERLEG